MEEDEVIWGGHDGTLLAGVVEAYLSDAKSTLQNNLMICTMLCGREEGADSDRGNLTRSWQR